jgi:GNAT superfamily N-acetyltransferase
MIQLLDAADFHVHADQLDRAGARGELREDGWFVAVAGGKVVGTVLADLALDYSDLVTALGFDPPHTYISAITVDAAHRGLGAGRALICAAAQAGAALGSSYLALVPAASDDHGNAPAEFFRRCGLVPLEEEREGARFGAPIAILAGST